MKKDIYARHPHRHRTHCEACAQRLEEAIQLYEGDLLAQFFRIPVSR